MSDYERGVFDYDANLDSKDNQSDEYYDGYGYSHQVAEISTARCVG